MTEEKNIKPKSVESMEQTQAVSTEVVNANIDSNSVGKTHKPSNLRGRWKRNSTGTATIKESDSKRPKEINTVKIEKARFTVLTDRLIRIEYSEDESFADRASQSVFYRDFPAAEYSNPLRSKSVNRWSMKSVK